MADDQQSDNPVVMVSSTALDLPAHRKEVKDACLRTNYTPTMMMEHLSAMDATAIEASLKLVDKADVYIGLFAFRYGYVPPGHAISITEMEYDRAVERGMPRLIFFMHDEHPLTAKDVEKGAGAEKLDALKARIGEERVVAFFKSPEELRALVVQALNDLRDQLAEADAVQRSAATLERLTPIPEPPTPYIAHPYTLLQTHDLVGRQQELNALTDWVATPGSQFYGARIFSFVAIGGMGKSALTWKWFNDIAPEELKPLAGRLWWSFYEREATFDAFITRALCYITGRDEDEIEKQSWTDQANRLLQCLNEKPYLIVLDGLERILTAYNRFDASRLADDDLDQQTANYLTDVNKLPETAAQSFVGQRRLRQSTDLRADQFLRALTGLSKSRILISTRLYPSALQTQSGQPLPNCTGIFLSGLSDDDALDLWRSYGVTGSKAELTPIFRSVEGHPLLVQALASEIAKDREAPGDFEAWRARNPQFNPADLPLEESRSHILRYALQGLTGEEWKALHVLVGFRKPASYDTLAALLIGDEKACATASALDQVLTALEDRGLIGWDREANRYDAHPIVRGVVWQLTDDQDKQSVHAALDAHFEPMNVPDQFNVESLADLTPAIERFHALVDLGRFDDAYDLFRDRLERATLYRLAAHQERITMLERLFPHGPDQTPALSKERDQGYVFNSLALTYKSSGQPGRSCQLYRNAAAIDEKEKDETNLAVDLANLGLALTASGGLFEAAHVSRRSLVLCQKNENEFNEAMGLQGLGQTLTVSGNATASELVLCRSYHLFHKSERKQAQSVVTAHLSEHALFQNQAQRAHALARRAGELAAHQRVERDVIHAALRQGQAALKLENLDEAEERLVHALTRARAVTQVEFELPALISLADLRWRQGKSDEAKTLLNEVWDPAERGPYPLRQADAYNLLSEINQSEGDTAAAIDAATKAYKAAWCDGPPYAYHWGLEKAKAHLASLGAPEPNLPPLDESRLAELPEVDLNPKGEYWVNPKKVDKIIQAIADGTEPKYT